ncbi:Bifunctional hemolysin/adenylate cyclase precursor [compost metagenome]
MPATLLGETRINTTTSGYQNEVSVAALADGGYIAVWSDQSSVSSDYIYTQRYNASGAKVGGQTQVNATTTGEQEDPVITALTGGGYVIAWKVESGPGQVDIRAQRYDANGTKLGAEHRVNTYSLGEQDSPEITALKDGGYVVAWASFGQDGSNWGAYLQRYDANGAMVGSETRINTTVVGEQDGPTIIALNDGGYLATWEGSGTGDSYGIFAQRFTAAGAKTGGEVRINTTTIGAQQDPAVAALTNGGYAVAWQSSPQGPTDDDSSLGPSDIYVQLYNASGAKVGGQTLANATVGGLHEEPRVVGLADGGYLVSWNGIGTGDSAGVFVQRFNATGAKVGPETRINTSTSNTQEFANIAALADGGYVVTWENYNADYSDSDIYLQRFDAKGNKITGLDGDAANNTLTWAGSSSVIINAGAGNDMLTGAAGNDHLNGGLGNDTLNGGGGADRMIGGDGSDTYYVDNNGDTVSETNAALATGGIDLVNSYLAAYTLGNNVENLRLLATGSANGTGNALNNVLFAGTGNNVLNGAVGNDTVSYAFATSAIKVSLASTTAQSTGGSGSDTLINIENLTGSNFNDVLVGNSLANTLIGGTGSDTLNGGAGADKMIGGDGADIYYVDNSGDIVSETNANLATGGFDTVYSYLASHTLGANVEGVRIMSTTAASATGNSLNNVLYAGAGNNTLDGAAGSDTASYAYAGSAVKVSLASTTAQSTGGSGADILRNIEHLTGSSYNDTLTGNSAANILNGGAGNDTLSAGAGNDTLIGGVGVDKLFGGAGADTFDFNALGEMGLGALRDVLADFKGSEGDKIDLSTLDANGGTAANDAFRFIGSSAFSGDASGQLRFANGVLYGSTDADTTAEFEISLLGVSSLTTDNFVL